MSVATAAGCEWNIASSASFIGVNVGREPQTGPGTIALRIAQNQGNERTATLTVAGKTIAIRQTGQPPSSSPSTPQPCVFAVDAQTYDLGPAATVVTIQITAPSHCTWSASTTSAFFTFQGPTSGAGSGFVSFKTTSAFDGPRTGTITIGNLTITIKQGPLPSCNLVTNPKSIPVPAAGGTVTIDVTNGPECGWTATATDAPFVAIVGSSSGKGNGTVVVTVQANTTSSSRTLRVRFEKAGSQSDSYVFIEQAPGPNCTNGFTNDGSNSGIGTQWFDSAGGTRTRKLLAPEGCEWALGGGGFVSYSPLSGIGPATITYTVSPNSGAPRVTTVTAGTKDFEIRQSQPIPSSGSFLSYSSDLQEVIGQSQAYLYTTNDGYFEIRSDAASSYLSISFHHLYAPVGWNLSVRSGDGTAFVPRAYEGATSRLVPPPTPKLQFSGEGRSCTVDGRFVVQEAVINVTSPTGGMIKSLRLSFEQQCEGSTKRLRGEVRLTDQPFSIF